MTKLNPTPDGVELVGIDIAMIRNEVLIEAADNARRRRLSVLNTRAAQDRVVGMNEREIEGFFAIIRRDTYRALSSFLSGLSLDVYACQEGIPFNGLEGYQALTAKLKYPHMGKI